MPFTYPIRLYGDPILRKKALPVQDFADVPKIAERMLETMYEARGVGLAAPQVGIGQRIFVAAEYHQSEEEEGQEAPLKTKVKELYVIVNPVITFREGTQYGTEGCLSIPGIYSEEVPRDLKLRMEYQNERGEPKALELEGFMAIVMQHEFDHLDGTLFFQRLPLQAKQKFMDTHREALAQMQRDAKGFLKELRSGSQ
jgi:peptide deformylase